MPPVSASFLQTLHYRIATDDDVDRLQLLIDLSVNRLGAGCYSPRQLHSALEYVFAVDRQLIADGTFYLAETMTSDAELVACGGWSRRRRMLGQDSATWNRNPGELLNPAIEPGRIRAFFVHPKWTQRGVASALLEHCEQAARERGFRALELAATLMGEPMYSRRGFIELERVDYELPDGTRLPVVRMLKPLVTNGARGG